MNIQLAIAHSILGLALLSPIKEEAPPIAPVIAPVLKFKAGEEIVLRIDLQNPGQTPIRYLNLGYFAPHFGVWGTKFELYRGTEMVDQQIIGILRPTRPSDFRIMDPFPFGRVPHTLPVTTLYGLVHELEPGEYTLKVLHRQQVRTIAGIELTPMSCYRTVAFLSIE